MNSKHPATFVRLSMAVLFSLLPACGSEAPNEPAGTGTGGSGVGAASGSGGSGAVTGSGGIATGTGGVGAAVGGNAPGTGGVDSTTGGIPATGGSAPGTGGSLPGTGGSLPGTGGSLPGTGGALPATGGAPADPSNFALNVEVSSAIPTVGIATWSLAVPVDSATLEFGRDPSSFELEAPVDLQAADHRTLLLGMKPNTTYYARVTASGGGQTYVSEVATIETGFLRNGLPTQTVTDTNASALYAGGGFSVLCTGYTTFGGPSDSSVAFVFDRDGDIVWAYDLSDTVASTCTRARMSLDGKYMWIGNFGNTTADGALVRISMDGLGPTSDYALPGRSHDFAILPNEHVAYFARDDGGADMSPESIFELDPATGATTLIYSELTDFGDLFDDRGGHTNQINYVPDLNALAFSMYFIDTIALVSYPEGQLLASFGGENSTFSTMTWSGQHGHDVHADHIDVFNNNGTNGGASVLRYGYDLQARTATQEFDYSAGVSSPAFGDVKELPNGNYFVTYSTAGVMHEIDASGNLLREVETSVTIGYVEHRGSLYGRPPPYGP